MPQVVLIVLNKFKNDSRVLKEAISLQKKGYNVKVVALWEPGLREEEIVSGVPVHRMKLFTKNWPKNKLIQLIKYLEFSIKFVSTYRKADIFHCNDLETLPIGVFIKRFFNKKAKIVYDAHEYETERNGLKGLQKLLAKILEKLLIKYADKVITVSNPIANEYKKLYPFIEEPVVVLNASPYKKVEKGDLLRKNLGIKKDKVIFLYQGGLVYGRGIEIILEAFKNIDNKLVIVFMGYGPLETLIKKESKNHSNIYFHPAVNSEILLEYTASADYGIHMAQGHCLSYYYALPNKMLEYIMAELPILVTDLPEMGKLVRKYQIGEVIKENNVKSLTQAIHNILKKDIASMKKNLRIVKKIYNWENEEKKLWKVYEALRKNKW